MGYGDESAAHLVQRLEEDFDGTVAAFQQSYTYINQGLAAFASEGEIFTGAAMINASEGIINTLGLDLSDTNPLKVATDRIATAFTSAEASESRKAGIISLVNSTMADGIDLGMFGVEANIDSAIIAMKDTDDALQKYMDKNYANWDEGGATLRSVKNTLSTYHQIDKIMTSADARVGALKDSPVYKQADARERASLEDDANKLSTAYLEQIAHYAHLAHENFFKDPEASEGWF